MSLLNPAARELIESGALAHLVTLAADGSPRVAIIWVGLDGDEIVAGHLDVRQHKLRNIAADPRVALSIESDTVNAIGLREYLVIRGRARLVEGGAPALLQRLAHVYLGPEVTFPPMPDAPEGIVSRITVEHVGGVGPWS
jgi:PPOX class probable F420-dependent enzyme